MNELTLYCSHINKDLTQAEWDAVPEHLKIINIDNKQVAITFDAIKQRQKVKNKSRASVLEED